MEVNIKEDLELLSKDLYLETPDLWIEFLDKINEGIFNELVLFLATKYNYVSIVKYAVDNNLIDLDSKSKNTNFKNIYDHLFYVSKQSKYKDVYNFLNNLKNPSENSNSTTNDSKNETLPSFICQNCKSNVFESGYIVCQNKVFKFLPQENKPVEVSSSTLDSVICNNCNCILPDTTPERLEVLCSITRCANCSEDLREVGILDNTSLVYDTGSNKFISNHTNYSCQKCNHILKKEQEEHFSLKN